MPFDKLTFGFYQEIEPGIVEAIGAEGVELSEAMIRQAEEALLKKYGDAPYAVLVNRLNPYSHTLESMIAAAHMKNLVATAIVVYNRTGQLAAELHQPLDPNLQIFDSREAALAWLRERLQAAGR